MNSPSEDYLRPVLKNVHEASISWLASSPILRPRLLIPQHHRHHPPRRGIERSPEIKARLHPCRPFDRCLGQRQINLMQRDRQTAIGIHREGHGEFRWRAALRLRQQHRVQRQRP